MINIHQKNSIFYLILEKLLLKIEPSEITSFFYKNFFPISGGTFLVFPLEEPMVISCLYKQTTFPLDLRERKILQFESLFVLPDLIILFLFGFPSIPSITSFGGTFKLNQVLIERNVHIFDISPELRISILNIPSNKFDSLQYKLGELILIFYSRKFC